MYRKSNTHTVFCIIVVPKDVPLDECAFAAVYHVMSWEEHHGDVTEELLFTVSEPCGRSR